MKEDEGELNHRNWIYFLGISVCVHVFSLDVEQIFPIRTDVDAKMIAQNLFHRYVVLLRHQMARTWSACKYTQTHTQIEYKADVLVFIALKQALHLILWLPHWIH